ncbi:MAG: hypothetical protein JXR67_10495 [Bacteroidales bacterium]|nr:hypothetical protein [Bacteroidales bacterium]
MNFLSFRRLLSLFLIMFCTISICEAQRSKRSIRNPERELFGKSLNTKRVKYRESPSVVRAKKKQAANQEKLKKDYAEYVKNERKRAVEIQSPEVRERMTANRKEADLKYKEKKKKRTADTKKARRKFR